MKKAFTLVEILLVVMIFWMLSTIMLRTYSTMSMISFRIGQDKELAKESLILSQVLDNIAQTATIDYERYNEDEINLLNNGWIVEKLYLTWDIRTGTQIYSTGSCVSWNILYDEDFILKKQGLIEDGLLDENNPCKLVLKKSDDDELVLLWNTEYITWEYKVSKIMFRVVPYDTTYNIIFDEHGQYNGIDAWKPAFWTMGAIYSKFYNPKKWSNSSILPLQFFYWLKGSTPSIYSYNDESTWE